MTLAMPGLQMRQLGWGGRFRGRNFNPHPSAPEPDRRAMPALFKPVHQRNAQSPLLATQIIRLPGKDGAPASPAAGRAASGRRCAA